MGFKDWNPLKVITLGIILIITGGVGLVVLQSNFGRLNLGFILFIILGVYATALGMHYYNDRKKYRR